VLHFPARLAILFAVPTEMAPLARRLKLAGAVVPSLRGRRAFSGRRGGIELLLVCGGVGARCAARAAQAVLSGWKPDALLMAGVAGALSPDLRVADIVIGDRVLGEDEEWLPDLAPTAAPDSDHVRRGPILSLDRVLLTPADKQSAVRNHRPTPNAQRPTPLASRLPPLAIEMETAAVARAAISAGVRWGAVRAISDTAGESLPLDFDRLRDEEGDLPVSRVVLAALTSPRGIPGLMRLGRHTALAAARLADFLAGWIETGAPGPDRARVPRR
jgi:adenosylhomocysteine nucleosidase